MVLGQGLEFPAAGCVPRFRVVRSHVESRELQFELLRPDAKPTGNCVGGELTPSPCPIFPAPAQVPAAFSVRPQKDRRLDQTAATHSRYGIAAASSRGQLLPT